MKVCIGGTFNVLHKGHKLLIDTAFQTAGTNGFVFIGLSIGNLLENKKDTKKYNKRKRNLENYLTKKEYMKHVVIKPISDKYGLTLEEDFDAIIVSTETKKTADEINIKRKGKGMKILKVITIPYILAEDSLPISSSRIKKGEIDENGKILKRE